MDKRLNYFKYFIFFITIILVVFLIFKENKEVEEVNSEKANQTVNYVKKEIDYSDWRECVNYQSGFSIKIPPEISGVTRCSGIDAFLVPVKVFEDNENNSTYIVPEYYYDMNSDSQKCKKIEYSIDLLKNPEKSGTVFYARPFLGWKIEIVKVGNIEDVNNFIKNNYGEACIVGSQKINKDGVYDIQIIGSDWDNGGRVNSTCYWEMHYKILYSPEKQKLLSVRTGPDYDFFVYDKEVQGGLIDYGQEMLKSLKIQ